MTIGSELEKLQKAKTAIRKIIQRKGSDLTLIDPFTDYYSFIREMSDEKTPNEDGLIDYVEDRCYFLEIEVDKIRPYAFRGYTCLKQLYLKNSQICTLENLNAFYGISPTILVPANLVDSYKVAPNWSAISDRIEAFTQAHLDEMYLIQHIDYIQTNNWLQSKTISEILKNFR